MAEEKSIIEILERQVELTKKQASLNSDMINLMAKHTTVTDELDAIKEVVKEHIKTQKLVHSAVFDKKYGYKDKAYKNTE